MDREVGQVPSASCFVDSDYNRFFGGNQVTKWTPVENKRFENALALFDQDTPERWFNVAAMIPGKTISDVMKQYQELVEDVSDIETGLIPIPGYANNYFALEWVNNHGHCNSLRKRSSATQGSDHKRKKGVPWTEEEHRQFLFHKKRSSIHDITTVDLTAEAKSPSPNHEDHHPSYSPYKSSLISQSQLDLHDPDNNAVMWRATTCDSYDFQFNNPGTTMAFSPPNSSSSTISTSYEGTPPIFGINLLECRTQHELWLEPDDMIF